MFHAEVLDFAIDAFSMDTAVFLGLIPGAGLLCNT